MNSSFTSRELIKRYQEELDSHATEFSLYRKKILEQIMKAELLKAINDISSLDELNEVIRLIAIKQKMLRAKKIAKAKRSISAGSKVKMKFSNGAKYGVVEAMKRTRAIVTIDGRKFDVPLSHLEAAKPKKKRKREEEEVKSDK